MTPLFNSPCDLAERMPTMAAEFLELETKIGRRFREDSVTDILIASLLKIGGSNATVFTPSEAYTGETSISSSSGQPPAMASSIVYRPSGSCPTQLTGHGAHTGSSIILTGKESNPRH